MYRPATICNDTYLGHCEHLGNECIIIIYYHLYFEKKVWRMCGKQVAEYMLLCVAYYRALYGLQYTVSWASY